MRDKKKKINVVGSLEECQFVQTEKHLIFGEGCIYLSEILVKREILQEMQR